MKLKNLLPVVGNSKVIYLISFGVFFVTLSIYLGCAGFPYIVAEKIKSKIALNNGSESMKAWEGLPAPLEFRIYMFNVTNPDGVSRGERPIVKEIGPYIYDEHREKLNVRFSKGDTLLYREGKTFFFNPKKSGIHQETDLVTTLNIPLIGSAYMVEEKFPMGLTFLNSALPYLFPNITNVFITVPVGDLLFKGVRIKCDYKTGPAMPICNGMRSNLPPPIRIIPGTNDFSFSMFQAVNSTPSGVFKIYRGNKNVYDLGQIIEYNNLTYLSMWERNSTCSRLRGTDSSILSPVKDSKDDIFLYLPEVCLSLRAKFVEEIEKYGIRVFKYESAKENFASPKEVKDNICRCKKGENGSLSCLKSGAIDATSCQGAPVILTPPHFLHGDEEYTSYPIGLNPDKSKHDTLVYMEPKTGAPLAAFKRIQMNIFLKRFEDINTLANVSEGLFPLIWVEEVLPDEILGTYLPSLKELANAMKILLIVTWVIAAIGLLLLVASGILYMKNNKIACFQENQLVSNISLAGARNPNRKEDETMDDKRTVYNIPTALVGGENNPQYNSSNTFFPDRIEDSLPRRTDNYSLQR